MRLLIIEDEIKLLNPLTKSLKRKGFAIDTATDGKEGFEKARINKYDCILLDLNLPKIDGIEVAKKLRGKNITTPIIMLTARSQITDKYDGFEIGADDYITKPYNFKELVYRINAVIKRNSLNKSEILKTNELELIPNNLTVKKNGKEIQLNPKEFGIIEYLVRNKGKIISQEELLEHIWDSEIDVFTQTVKTHIKTLRQKIDKDKSIIKTIRGAGYIINE